MRNTKNNGGPAFPRPEKYGAPCMTLRDYFAAKVMVAFIHAEQHAAMTQTRDRLLLNDEVEDRGADGYIFYAEEAYDAADAMLRAREHFSF